jgi:hypothetical protein
MKMVGKFIFSAWLALQLLASGALAAEKLQVNLIPKGARARNAAPVPVDVRFKWDSTRILEGRLEMEFLEGSQVLGQFRSGDLALTGGEQTFRMLLPPALSPDSDAQVEVQMKFVSAGNVIQLDSTILSLPTAGDRSLVLGLCDAGTADSQSASDLVRDLRLEHFAPQTDTAAQKGMMTSIVRLTPEDLPAQPLGYTPFDMMVVTAQAFKGASERQLQALARWVKGGGSVCVFVSGGLQPQHVRFLNQLNDSIAGGPLFQADSEGNLLSSSGGILQLHSGVGRSVIVAGASLVGAGLDSAAWQNAAAFLWKMRFGQSRSVATSGHWGPPGNSEMNRYSVPWHERQWSRWQVPPPNRQPFGLSVSYSVQPTDLGANLMNRLMPHTVRLIPFSALLGLLGLFLLMIGPGDYFILGWLRRRRLTWLLFPALSVAFTIATVLMANHYLGLRDQRRALVVVDLDRDGAALRWNRYELVFAARDKQSVTELKDALWSPLFVSAMPAVPNTPYYYSSSGGAYPANMRRIPPNPNNAVYPSSYQTYLDDAGGEGSPPLYDGVLPVHYQTSKTLRQWRPELNRVFSFEPPPVPMFANWKAIEAASPDLRNIRAQISEKKPFNGDVLKIYNSGSVVADEGSTGLLPESILGGLCAGNGGGLLSVVSQISPTGGSNFEDAQAMDTEGNDSALAIVTQVGDDIVVYRRFFYGN